MSALSDNSLSAHCDGTSYDNSTSLMIAECSRHHANGSEFRYDMAEIRNRFFYFATFSNHFSIASMVNIEIRQAVTNTHQVAQIGMFS